MKNPWSPLRNTPLSRLSIPVKSGNIIKMKFILTFGSTHKVLKAESILKAHEVAFRLDPAPKALAAYCDLVITVEEELVDRAFEVLTAESSGPGAIYKKEGDEYVKV